MGRLNLLVGGDPELFEELRPLLSSFSDPFFAEHDAFNLGRSSHAEDEYVDISSHLYDVCGRAHACCLQIGQRLISGVLQHRQWETRTHDVLCNTVAHEADADQTDICSL